MEPREIVDWISAAVEELLADESPVNERTPLIGRNGVLDSMSLVEICLALEDKADELGFEFDWTSDSTLSQSRSMFRTVASLADEFSFQYKGSVNDCSHRSK